MFTASDFETDVKRVLGACDDATFYSRLSDAVEILAAESDWDPLRAYIDVCVSADGQITLPRQVETVLAVNIDGRPSQGHDFWFQFHLNGPGSGMTKVPHHWSQIGPVAVFRDPPATGARLVASIEKASDAGKRLRVFGYDSAGNWIRTAIDGTMQDGFLVPLVYGSQSPNPLAPLVRTITRVSKPETDGVVTLSTLNSDTTRTRIGQYFPKETEPQYRRIQVSRGCSWARIAFKRAVEKITQPDDLVPLHSKYAVVLMCKALKKFDEDRIEEGEQYRQMAIDLLRKKQLSVEIPGGPSIQVANGNLISDRGDRMI